MLRRASSAALLIALAAATPAWAAKPKADLAEKSVKTSVTSVLDGGTLKVTDVTKNGGKAKSGKSATGYYLSSDRKKSKGDRLLGRRSIKKLKRRKSSKGSKVVRIPASTLPGSYYVLACADSKGSLKEKSEHNNCKASAKKLKVVAPKPLPAPAPTPGGNGPTSGSQCSGDGTPACAQDLGTIDPTESRHVSDDITPGDVDWFKIRVHEAHQTSAGQMQLDWTLAAGSENPGSGGILDVEFWDPAMMGPADTFMTIGASETGVPVSSAQTWGERQRGRRRQLAHLADQGARAGREQVERLHARPERPAGWRLISPVA